MLIEVFKLIKEHFNSKVDKYKLKKTSQDDD